MKITPYDRPKCPPWILEREGINNGQWKSRKRRELKAVIKAMETYRMGCAYCPGKGGQVFKIDTALRDLKYLLSQKQWGK